MSFFPATSDDQEIAVLHKMGITAEEVLSNMPVRIILKNLLYYLTEVL